MYTNLRTNLALGAVLLALIVPPTEARTVRSAAAKSAFKRQHPCPATGRAKGPCPGYVIDHVTPLACGGADDPANMQWQTVAEGKAKDKWERKRCLRHY